jgi:hypothetical protein
MVMRPRKAVSDKRLERSVTSQPSMRTDNLNYTSNGLKPAKKGLLILR